MARPMPRGDMAVLSDGPPVNGHRPSADVLFRSVAQAFAMTSVGVLMTGMGEDGAEGLGAIKAAGGMTVAQSEDSCVVSGMPRAAIVKGYANKIVPLDAMSAFLVGYCGSDRAPDRDRGEKGDRHEKFEKNEKSDTTHVSSHRS
jgi:two-component system chemotaxis response regulator CheB